VDNIYHLLLLMMGTIYQYHTHSTSISAYES